MTLRFSRATAPLTLTTALLTVLACTEDPETGETGPSDTSTDTGTDMDTGDGDGDAAVTFWQDVAPIYYERCVSCHRDDGIGPFVLDDYANAAAWAELSAVAVEDRVMPPWLVTDDGSCNTWQHSPTLDQDEIDTIVAWVEAGTPEGEPRDDLELPVVPGLSDAHSFTTPQFVPMPEGGIFAKNDEYRCFVVDPEIDHDMFITAHQVIPGNDALVHHVLAMPVDPNLDVGDGLTNLDVIQALDAESPDRAGWSCFGAAGDGVDVNSFPVSWAPGQGVVELPANSGARLGADDLLVIQVHYNMVDTTLIGESDQSTVKLRLVDEVETEGLFDLVTGLIGTIFEGQPYLIPAGDDAHTFTFRLPADWYIGWQGSEKIELWGYFPHMHGYGTSMSARVLDAEGQEVGCVAEVPRWDFDWQLYYFLDSPIILEPGYEIEVSCTYDTTSAAGPISPGWGSESEMCLAGIYIVPG